MIKILVVEDTAAKAGKIAKLLDSITGCSYEIASDLVTARKFLQDHFNIMILDLHLPERFSEAAIESKGFDFVLEIRKTRRLKVPDHILGLTEHTEVHLKYKSIFDENLISLVQYDPASISWESKIRTKIEELQQSSIGLPLVNTQRYDIAFVNALRSPELDAVLELDYQWQKKKIPNDSANYFEGKIELPSYGTLNVVATHLPQMGMVATATSTMKIIEHFRPKFVIMTGICGGVEGKVNLGDVVISDMSFDLESGKIVVDPEGKQGFEPDYRVIPINSSLKEAFIDLATDDKVLAKIKSNWKGNKISRELNLHVGPVGSGAAVISNKDYIENKIKHQRKLIAIDMESYAISYCCEYCTKPQPIPILIKSVSDYANPDKGDNMQKYCATMSAWTADYIIRNILTFD